ncbi:hypothetical protein HDK77DRAFT_276324 [Phyllosticta capitalensis]|uniref:Uncharacterized protein n=1 Tax=Phyllosticta capitalensis TaxID=121624 RepID=A0ABR1YI98_9PEZI
MTTRLPTYMYPVPTTSLRVETYHHPSPPSGPSSYLTLPPLASLFALLDPSSTMSMPMPMSMPRLALSCLRSGPVRPSVVRALPCPALPYSCQTRMRACIKSFSLGSPFQRVSEVGRSLASLTAMLSSCWLTCRSKASANANAKANATSHRSGTAGRCERRRRHRNGTHTYLGTRMPVVCRNGRRRSHHSGIFRFSSASRDANDCAFRGWSA